MSLARGVIVKMDKSEGLFAWLQNFRYVAVRYERQAEKTGCPGVNQG